MRNEIAVKELKSGQRIVTFRGVMKAPKVFKDANRYTRKSKHRTDLF